MLALAEAADPVPTGAAVANTRWRHPAARNLSEPVSANHIPSRIAPPWSQVELNTSPGRLAPHMIEEYARHNGHADLIRERRRRHPRLTSPLTHLAISL